MKTFNPRPYQDYCKDRMLREKALGLFLRPGLGKTVTALTAIFELVYDYFDAVRVLVIAPKRVAQMVWTDEINEWSHLRGLKIIRVLGTEKQRITALNTQVDVYVINRENVVWLVEHFGKDWPFDMVVVDESSSFKNHQAKRFKALRRVRPLVKRIVLLTGTPAPKSYLNLWPQLYLLDRGERLGKTITAYRDKYFEPDQRNGVMVYSWKLKEGAKDLIDKAISDICVSVSGNYVQEPIINDIKIVLPDQIMKLYKQLERDLLLPYQDGDVVASTAAVLNNKLLQLANGAIYDENKNVRHIHDAKLDALEELIDEAQGEPVFVLYTYKHDRDRIMKRFVVRELKTEQDKNDWNAGKIPIMIAHPASCGHGLNLQFGGHITVWFGLTWDLELYEQANARLNRPGQKEQGVIHRLLTVGTMDQICAESLKTKDVTQNGLMEAIKAKIQEVLAA